MHTTPSVPQKPIWIWKWTVLFILCFPVGISCWLDFQRQSHVCDTDRMRALCTSSIVVGGGNARQPERPQSTTTVPLTTPTLSLRRTMYVTAPELNMRAGPGIDYERIAKLSQHDAVIILGEQHQVETSLWFFIEARNKTGWVNSKFLSEAAP